MEQGSSEAKASTLRQNKRARTPGNQRRQLLQKRLLAKGAIPGGPPHSEE